MVISSPTTCSISVGNTCHCKIIQRNTAQLELSWHPAQYKIESIETQPEGPLNCWEDEWMNGTPKFLSAAPVLPASNIAEAIAFYAQNLGFATDFQAEDYAGLSRGPVQIHLWLCNDRRLAESSGCRINIQGIDQLYKDCQAQNIVHPNGSLVTKPWGLREFTVQDLSGNCITFAELPPPTHRRDRTD